MSGVIVSSGQKLVCDTFDHVLYDVLLYVPIEIWMIIFEYVRWIHLPQVLAFEHLKIIRQLSARPPWLPLKEAKRGDIVAVWLKTMTISYTDIDYAMSYEPPQTQRMRTDEPPTFVRVTKVTQNPHKLHYEYKPMIPKRVNNKWVVEQGVLNLLEKPNKNTTPPAAYACSIKVNVDDEEKWWWNGVSYDEGRRGYGGVLALTRTHVHGGYDGFVVSRGLSRCCRLVQWTKE